MVNNQRKRILIFADWYDPAFRAGGPIRSCINFVEQMKTDFDLYVFTGSKDHQEKSDLEGIIINEWVDHYTGAKVFYSNYGFLSFGTSIKVIKHVKPDFIYFNSMFSQKFLILPLILVNFSRFSGKIVLSPRGMLKNSALQFQGWKKAIWLNFLKLSGIADKIIFHATDEQEFEDIKQKFEKNTIIIAPNFPKPLELLKERPKKIKGALAILFVGRIHSIKQLDYLLLALNNLKGNVSLTVIGLCEDSDYWLSCQKIIAKLPSNIKVRFEGSKPHEFIDSYMFSNHIFALPSKGENFGHAIFEALGSGLPVLISDQTPWKNLQANNAGWDIDLSKFDLFVEALEKALGWDDDMFQIWSGASRKFAENYQNGSELKEKYIKIFS